MPVRMFRLTKKLLKGVGAVGTLALTAVAGGIAYSLLGVDHDAPLSPAIDAPRRRLRSERAGWLNYYADTTGEGRPLVLLHSINAAPSAHEVRPLFEHYQGRRPVYALDWPGFGMSERGERRYSPEMYASALNDFMSGVIGGDGPADVVALSLGCEFAARAAHAAPEHYRSLTLISPTGVGMREIRLPGLRLYRILTVPLWSQPLFDLITSRRSIRYYSDMSFVGEAPQQFVDYAYATAHQPGARFAPLYFLSGQLFTSDVRTSIYEKLTRPVLVIYDEDPNIEFDRLPELLAANSGWQAERIIPSRGLPHWEKLEETAAVLERFWDSG